MIRLSWSRRLSIVIDACISALNTISIKTVFTANEYTNSFDGNTCVQPLQFSLVENYYLVTKINLMPMQLL